MVIMVIVSLLIFFILKTFIGTFAAVVCSIAFIAVWFAFNVYANTTGLIKTNMNIYFNKRSMGHSHEEALELVVKSRYPSSPENQVYVREMLKSMQSIATGEREDIKSLIYIIHRRDLSIGPKTGTDADHRKFFRKIDEIYDKMIKSQTR